MKIAFASGDGVHLDQQFRRASRIAVYQVGPAGPRLDQTFTFAADRSVRTEERLASIRDAAIVFGTAFGPSTAARLLSRGIRPATARTGTRIAELLSRFNQLERISDTRGAP
jgi:predicted Fe-Mo cluster-binding NifX family protein